MSYTLMGHFYGQHKWSFSNGKRKLFNQLNEELQGNTSQGKSMREEKQQEEGVEELELCSLWCV